MKSIHPTSSSSTWQARAGSGILAAATCLFLMATFATPVQAQVTYRPILASSDFSTISTNGTATILYSLQGAPAESPYGSSFSISFSLGPLGGSGSPLSYGSILRTATTPVPNNEFSAILLRIVINTTNLHESDFIQMANVENAEQQAFNHELTPKHSFTYTTGALEAAPNWSLTSGSILGRYDGSQNITYKAFMGIQDSNGNSLTIPSPTGFGTTTTVNPYFVNSGPDVAQALLNTQISTTQYRMSFQNLTFTPVPEPGGAFLVATAGLWFILRRRRIC